MRVPKYAQQVTPQSATMPQMDASGVMQGQRLLAGSMVSLAGAVGDVGDTIQQIAERNRRADATIRSINATTSAARDLNDLQVEFATDTDYETAVQRYDEKAQAVRETLLGQFQDPTERAQFLGHFEELQLSARNGVINNSERQRRDAANAALDTSIEQAVRDAANAPDDVTRSAHLSRAAHAITSLQEQGLISLVDAGKRTREMLSGVAEADAQKLIRVDPAIAADALADPQDKRFNYLDPLARERLARIAEGRRDGQLSESARIEAKNERAAQKTLQQRGDDAARDMYGRAADGKLDRAWLDSQRQYLTPSEYQAGLRMLTGDGKDSIDTVRRLEREIDTRDLKDDILSEMGRGLSQETGQQLLDKNRRFLSDDRPASPWKRGREYIRTALSSEAMIFDDPAMAAAVKKRQADALEEYDVWFDAHPQASSNEAMGYYRDLVRRSVDLVSTLGRTTLTVPRFVKGDRNDITIDAIDRAEQDLAEQYRAGAISGNETRVEASRLADWRNALLIEAQQAATAAGSTSKGRQPRD